MKKLTALLLIFALLLTGCAASSGTPDTVATFSESADSESAEERQEASAQAFTPTGPMDAETQTSDFAIRLFRQSLSETENTLVSPLSVLSALAMTANGAKGDTLSQMENTLGMTTAQMNDYISGYLSTQSEELKLANAIWFTNDDSFTVNEDFLDTVTDYYHADIKETAFDQAACDAINAWVEGKTDGMIPKILDQIPDEAVMYLVNALAFEAKWADPYENHQVYDGTFTKADGTAQTVEMMSGEEAHYLEDARSTGFIKYYENEQYAFVALLPNYGIRVEDFVQTLNGEHLRELLENPVETTVKTKIPKFETEFSVEMSDILISMGMEDAFNSSADFSGLGVSDEKPICISRVLHKTYISVAQEGTRASAATAVEMMEAGAAPDQDYKTVILDRPFVYMIVDCADNQPIFIGALMDAKA